MNCFARYIFENNITSISNTAGIVNGLGGVYSYSFDYDDMYRLVSANGSFKNQYDYTLSMSYSPSGNITNKTLEALTLQAGIDVPVDYEANYNYNSGRPHAIESISGTNADHAFQWDENGNMTLHNDQIAGFNRILCWDEENRLTAVRDENNLSAYIYDAGGERVWKLTGQVQQMYVDGTGWIDIVDLNNKTLYVSPYLVFNETGYSKHYYAGAERVSSRIGGGMQDGLVDPLNYTVEILSGQDYTVMAGDLQDMLGRNIECTDMPMQYVSMEQRLGSIEESKNHNNTEDNRYIYHSDHLGSSSFLTDVSGNPTQHLQYLPFGEPFIEQRSVTDYYTPYTFSAKERDLETGYSYFGARYYNSHISVWLSVDPMSDKYPYQSGYCYVGLRPLIVIDPNGMWEWDANGNLVAQKGDQSYSLAKFLGTNQKNAMTILNRSGVTANDKGILNLKEGQVLSKESLYIDKEPTSSVTVNNTTEATQHYLNGKGETADVGNASTNELLQSEEFRSKHQRITSIADIDPDGFFAVNMTHSTFHIGKTQVKYDISQNGSSSSVKYGLFYSNIWGSDGFWDVDIIDGNILGRIPIIRDWTKTTPDGPGPNLERLGGTTYHYELRERTYFFMPPR